MEFKERIVYENFKFKKLFNFTIVKKTTDLIINLKHLRILNRKQKQESFDTVIKIIFIILKLTIFLTVLCADILGLQF